jgi:hypothetical protein
MLAQIPPGLNREAIQSRRVKLRASRDIQAL